MKNFFESAPLLIGVPFLVIGLAGALIAILVGMAPERPQPAAEYAGAGGASGGMIRVSAHPGPAEYVMVGVVLAVITALEVAIYYVDITALLVPALLVLSATKFILVVAFFMHLRFDSQLFTSLFTGGMVLAVAVFIVVLATLGASLR